MGEAAEEVGVQGVTAPIGKEGDEGWEEVGDVVVREGREVSDYWRVVAVVVVHRDR